MLQTFFYVGFIFPVLSPMKLGSFKVHFFILNSLEKDMS